MEDVDWIHLANNRDRWLTFELMSGGNCAIFFSRRRLLHGFNYYSTVTDTNLGEYFIDNNKKLFSFNSLNNCNMYG